MNESRQISEEQRMTVLRYLDDRRSKYMIRMILTGGLALLLTIPALQDAATLFGKSFLIFQPSFATRDTGLLAFGWFGLIIAFLIFFALGFQRWFGGHAPLNEIRSYAFTVREITLSTKGEDKGVHPFLIRDMSGTEYTCPVYLDYKKSERGERMIGITTDHGAHFALRTEESKHEAEIPQDVRHLPDTTSDEL